MFSKTHRETPFKHYAFKKKESTSKPQKTTTPSTNNSTPKN
jgi:hypothetical protein